MPNHLTLSLLLLASLLFLSLASPSDDILLDDDELALISDQDDAVAPPKHSPHSEAGEDDEFNDDEEEDDFGSFDDFDGGDAAEEEVDDIAVDDKDVVVLRERNFTDAIENNRYVMVEFYAPWCGHCKSLAPEYAAAAKELKVAGEDIVLAKVDATKENELAHQYNVEGFPTILFFVDGEHKTYNAQRTKAAIVTWIKKKIGPGVNNVSTVEEAERILASEGKLVMGFLDSLVGSEAKELAAASKLDDDVNFYQTTEPSVAKLFHIDVEAKRPALVLVKKEDEKITHFDGKLIKSEISEFVFSNKAPLVTIFTRESAPSIFDSAIKKQILLFASLKDSEKVLPIFIEAAKSFKGKIIFVYVELDNEDYGKPVADYFGITGDAPQILGYLSSEDAKKYIYDMELTLEKIKAYGEDFVAEKLKPFYKSDPIPETNDGDVKIVVGNNFDEIVLDESKDVLLEVYAPWCGHCQSLEPTYNKLAKHLHEIESIVVAKMDGTTNENPRAKADGFPTLLFFPAGNKSSDPITVEADRTVLALYKFLKKHASIPFKLQKPVISTKAEGPVTTDTTEGINAETLKDEL